MGSHTQTRLSNWARTHACTLEKEGYLIAHSVLTGSGALSSQRMCVCVSRSVVSDSLWPHGLQPTRLLCPWDFPGKGTGVGCHFLLQGIFPTQESNPGLLHCRQILYRLSYKGRPPQRIEKSNLSWQYGTETPQFWSERERAAYNKS